VLDRATLNRRLLLVLFALGTNMGIRQMAVTGEHGQSEAELRHVRATYVTRENLRQAVTTVVNATLETRDPAWWGQATSTASDSIWFASWDSNLMTEFHARYGGYGVMIYWHVERGRLCICSQLKSCSSSEVAAMIEGLLRHAAWWRRSPAPRSGVLTTAASAFRPRTSSDFPGSSCVRTWRPASYAVDPFLHRVKVNERQGLRTRQQGRLPGQRDQELPGCLLQLADVPPGIAAQVRAQRGRRPDAAEQRGHRTVPQQVHVIDRIRSGGHPGHQARDLQVRVDAALAARPDVLSDQIGQPGALSQRHHRDQARVRHQIRVVEGCLRPGQAMQQSHLTGTLRTRRRKLQTLSSSQFRGHLSR
jgi:Tn3 transposase DDE domain